MTHPAILALERREVATLAREHPPFRPGDRLRVHAVVEDGERRRLQVFEGDCIARGGSGMNETFLMRRVSFGYGVERKWPLQCPSIDRIEVVRRGQVRRAKLYYLRGRTGKAARIRRRKDRRYAPYFGWGRDESGIDLSSDNRVNPLEAMLTVLQTFDELDGDADGDEALSVVEAAVEALPEVWPRDVRPSTMDKMLLAVGEDLCPLMFSPDPRIVSAARRGMNKLADLYWGDRKGAQNHLPFHSLLERLELAIVMRLLVRVDEDAARVRLKVDDLALETTSKGALDDEGDVRVEVFVEDLEDRRVDRLGEDVVSPRHGPARIEFIVPGDQNALDGKILTVVADGRQIFRERLGDGPELVVLA